MLTKEVIQRKIDFEIVMDCYDDYEIAVSWITTMNDDIEFPFLQRLPN